VFWRVPLALQCVFGVAHKTAHALQGGIADLGGISPDGQHLVASRNQGNDYQVFLRDIKGFAPTMKSSMRI
jgi:hypothetical protein